LCLSSHFLFLSFSSFYEIPQAIEDPQTGERVKKSVFAVTFMGAQLARRVGRIVSHNNGSEYPIPATPNEIMALERDIQFKLNDAVMVLQRTDAEIKELLGSLAVDPATAARGTVSSPYLNWLTALQRERHICDILKKCDQEGPHSKMITLEGWCPSDSLEELKQALHNAVRVTQAKQAALQVFDHPPSHAAPPTYFKTNKFTESYQGIVDTYGVPRYKEVNPGLFTIISFPFLFGIMYGDVGHGTLLFLFALYLLWNEEKMLAQSKRGQLSEIPSMIFGGRYLLLLMGAFALYAGTIYNDLFSCPIDTFGSHWDLPGAHSNRSAGVQDFSGVPYPYGVDPSWYHTSNELAFFNSMKMKLAVTLGVTQMVFGICLGALNDIYFKDYLAILCVPILAHPPLPLLPCTALPFSSCFRSPVSLFFS
jgi:V-type H+-transporting ATPase subunit a